MIKLAKAAGWLAVAGLTGCVHPGGKTTAGASADFTIRPGQVITADYVGIGTEYNQNLYAPISGADGITEAGVGNLEAKVKQLGSQHVRIFFDSRSFDTTRYPGYLSSFIRTVGLAQASGSSVNITYWHGPYEDAAGQMSAFADVLRDLIVTRGLTAVRYVTIQNEVNSTAITMQTYETLYRQLSRALQQRGLRKSIELIGGDLVRTNQQAWFSYMAEHMDDILDGYSVHIYWNYTDTGYAATRLAEVRRIVDALPAGKRKPVFITEFGVRGDKTACPGPGCLTGTATPIEGTLVNAFQHAWFSLKALNEGYVALVKWDAYKARYDSGNQFFSEIGSGSDGYPLTPVYWETRFFTATSKPGWRVEVVTARVDDVLVSALAGPSGGERTVYVLNDTGGPVPVSVAGLPAGTTLHLVSWNADGGGDITDKGTVQTDEAGAVKINVSFQSIDAITTLDPAKMHL